MNVNKEVDAWFERFDHPLKDAMIRVREVILGADSQNRRDDQVEHTDLHVQRQPGQLSAEDEEVREPEVSPGSGYSGRPRSLGGRGPRLVRFQRRFWGRRARASGRNAGLHELVD
jgi:hypothetical protein